MSLVFFTFVALWFVVTLLDYGSFCYVWQLKEYRLDRFNDFISTKQGKDFLKSYLVRGRMMLIVPLLILWSLDITPAISLVIAWLFLELAGYLYKYFKKQYRRPKRTAKAYLIVLVAVALEVGIFFATGEFMAVLLLACLRFAVTSAVVGLFALPTKLIKQAYIIRATKKLSRYRELKIVGVTGSYGKTTVKNFLEQILSAKFRVIATPKNINTEIGIAKFILNADFSQADIFVVEMGAYNLGEIKLICEMVRPKIGILTAINEQHLSLFGSIKNTQQAKYELLNALPADGLAITNADNSYCRELLGELKVRVKTFGQNSEYKPTGLVKNLETGPDGSINFTFVANSEELKISASVVGEHNALNIAPCILVAKELGMDDSEIADQARKLKLPQGTLQVFNYGESLILDDSYNSNPEGFSAALKVLGKFPAELKKIVITRGMLELGDRSAELHQKIGKEIAGVADELVIISADSEADLNDGVAGSSLQVQTKYGAEDLLEYVKTLKDVKAVVLLENRVPDKILKELTS